MTMTRRGFVHRLSALGALATCSRTGFAQERLPTRAIPSTGEQLPIVGFGSSKAVRLIPEEGTDALAAVMRLFVSFGGRVVDTTPYPEENERRFGEILQSPDLRDEVFLTMKINTMDEEVGVRQVRQAQRLFGLPAFDVLQVMSLRGLHAHWPNLRTWKESGETRYVGVTVSNYEDYGALEDFITSESVDFLQVNFSVVETLAEDRILPLAEDLGIAVIANGPFMNGDYFGLVRGHDLPPWAAEFDCSSWAQFSLKYILSHPGVNCVLTETTDPQHMRENVGSAFGAMPDAATRRRMRELVGSL